MLKANQKMHPMQTMLIMQTMLTTQTMQTMQTMHLKTLLQQVKTTLKTIVTKHQDSLLQRKSYRMVAFFVVDKAQGMSNCIE